MKRTNSKDFLAKYDAIRNKVKHPQVSYKDSKYIAESTNIGEQSLLSRELFKMEMRSSGKNLHRFGSD